MPKDSRAYRTSQTDTQTAAKPETESPYNSTPTLDLTDITDIDIRPHELLAAQAPTRASVVSLDAQTSTVATPKSTSAQTNSNTVGVDAHINPELANVIEAATAGVEGRKPNLPQHPVKSLDPETARLNEIAAAAIEHREPNLPKADGSTPFAVDENSETEHTENTELNMIDDLNDTIHKKTLYRRRSNAGPFSHLIERMSKKYVKQLAKRYGIDLEGVSIHIDKSEELLRFRYFGRADSEHIGGITLFPNAFESKEELLRTVYHEKVHVEQYRKYGTEYVQNNRKYFEDLAYKAEDDFMDKLKERGLL